MKVMKKTKQFLARQNTKQIKYNYLWPKNYNSKTKWQKKKLATKNNSFVV